MSGEAKTFWDGTIAKLVETSEWKKEVEVQGWEQEYKNSEEFSRFLKEQEKQKRIIRSFRHGKIIGEKEVLSPSSYFLKWRD